MGVVNSGLDEPVKIHTTSTLRICSLADSRVRITNHFGKLSLSTSCFYLKMSVVLCAVTFIDLKLLDCWNCAVWIC